MTKPNPAKSLVHELKGDAHAKKGKHQKAVLSYQKALELNPERIEIYDKLISSHNASKDKWTEEDFVYNMELVMQKQELLDPAFKRVHARHEPESREIALLIKKMIMETDAAKETEIVEEIVSYGVNALYPLIDVLLGMKQSGTKHSTKSELAEKCKEFTDRVKKEFPKQTSAVDLIRAVRDEEDK